MAESRTLVARAGGALAFEAGAPLHRRAPARDEYGHPLGDFMVLIPRLRERRSCKRSCFSCCSF